MLLGLLSLWPIAGNQKKQSGGNFGRSGTPFGPGKKAKLPKTRVNPGTVKRVSTLPTFGITSRQLSAAATPVSDYFEIEQEKIVAAKQTDKQVTRRRDEEELIILLSHIL